MPEPGPRRSSPMRSKLEVGWPTWLGRRPSPRKIDAYARLKTHIQSFRYIVVLDFDEGAAVKYRELTQSRLRIDTMDLKIAAIVFAHDAILLSRNLSDFRKVPGLKVEDWTLPSES